MIEANVKIYGQVQGVNFRSETARQAKSLNLTGWTRNELDGSVVIVVQGNRTDIEELIDWAKNGPSFATVESVQVSWCEPQKKFETFLIRY